MSEKAAPASPKAAKGAPTADVAHKPFGVLLASAPPRIGGGVSSGILSTIFHIALAFAFVATTVSSGEEEEEDVTQIVETVVETNVPPPPPPPPPPEMEAQMPDVTVISAIEMPTVVLSTIPAPRMDVVFDARALAAGTGTVVASANRQDSTEANPDVPGFTPMTVRPTLTNTEEVQRVLMREYPAVLRDAGIGGAPVLWLYIGTDGSVQRTQVNQSSGFEALDAAAANVATAMRFTPAQNRDQTVAVWVQIPIRFQVIN
jgi:periplasmic protein TonB